MLWLGLVAPCCVGAQANDTDSGDSRAQCLALSATVAEICPRRCTHKHCDQRCIPPLSDDGLCQTCQDRCAEICERQTERHARHCAGAAAINGPANE